MKRLIAAIGAVVITAVTCSGFQGADPKRLFMENLGLSASQADLLIQAFAGIGVSERPMQVSGDSGEGFQIHFYNSAYRVILNSRNEVRQICSGDGGVLYTNLDALDPPLPYTEEALDYIRIKASQDAQEASMKTIQEAYDYIYHTMAGGYSGFYATSQSMERAVYYGLFLDFAYQQSPYRESRYAGILSKLGRDMAEAVQDVYRGSAPIEGLDVQAALKQVSADINHYIKKKHN